VSDPPVRVHFCGAPVGGVTLCGLRTGRPVGVITTDVPEGVSCLACRSVVLYGGQVVST
jgi:hypothetical protein